MSSTLENGHVTLVSGRLVWQLLINQEMIPQYYFNESVNVKINEIAMPRMPRCLACW